VCVCVCLSLSLSLSLSAGRVSSVQEKPQIAKDVSSCCTPPASMEGANPIYNNTYTNLEATEDSGRPLKSFEPDL
jgi:hypothetical protein